MACSSCGQRRQILGQAAKAMAAGKPVSPMIRAFGKTVKQDLKSLRPNPRLGMFNKR